MASAFAPLREPLVLVQGKPRVSRKDAKPIQERSLPSVTDMMKHPRVLILSLALATADLSLFSTANAQAKNKEQSAASASCQREPALNIIRQQIDATRTFDDAVQRISVLLRAADMLWPFQQDDARAAFTEAFDLATSNYKERGDRTLREGVGLVASTPDQRYGVISAIARHDYPWARKLTGQVLKQEAEATKEKPASEPLRDRRTSEKIFGMALSLVATDPAVAINIARTGLGYTATMYLPLFLYSLAETNQPAADQFYLEALAAYRDKPMGQFLYLSAFPFGNNRDAGEMPGYTYYRIPANFSPNNSLQRLFVQTLLRRAHQAFENPSDTEDLRRVTENGQIWLALTRLEKQIQQSLPDLVEAAEQAKASNFSVQSPKSQSGITKTIADQDRPKMTFDAQVEAADKERDSARRDERLTFAVTGAPATEALGRVVSAAEKIADPGVKEQLLNWIYFNRAQGAINLKQLDEARRLAARVSELDQRAYLYSEIAKEALNQAENQQQAQQILDEVLTAAGKAPNTMVTARTLLAVTYLYTKIDFGRAMSVLGDAIKCINRVEAPDFSQQSVIRRIEGKTFGSYANFQTPGFSPQNVFREIGKLDFDGALYQANNFTSKHLRSLTTLALVEPCVQQAPVPSRPEKTPTKAEPKKAP